jgi:hypothetical protein
MLLLSLFFLALLDQGTASVLKDGNGIIEAHISPFHLDTEPEPQGMQGVEFCIVRVLLDSVVPVLPACRVVAVVGSLVSESEGGKADREKDKDDNVRHTSSGRTS